MKVKIIFPLCFLLFVSTAISAQNSKIKIPDSLVFSGKHFSFSGLCGYAQPAVIKQIYGPHSLGAPLNEHFGFGLAFTFWKKQQPIFFSAGLKVDLWFETLRLNITKNSSNNLLFDMNEWESDYYIESYYYYFETGHRYNLGRNFFAIPFFGLGVEYVHPIESTSHEWESDSINSSNYRLLLYSESSNKEIPRFHFRAHAGVGLSYILPYGHIISLRLVGSWSNGMIGKGHYILVPGTLEESSGTYDLRGSYLGIDLVYTFTGIRKKKMELKYSDKKY